MEGLGRGVLHFRSRSLKDISISPEVLVSYTAGDAVLCVVICVCDVVCPKAPCVCKQTSKPLDLCASALLCLADGELLLKCRRSKIACVCCTTSKVQDRFLIDP